MNTPANRIMLKNVRLAFPVLDVPEKFQGQGDPRFSATLLLDPGSENEKLIKAAMFAAAEAKWGANKAQAAVDGLSRSGKTALGDGNTKDKYDGFEGKLYVQAHAREKTPPTLLDMQAKPLPRNTGMIYAGCYVNASIEFWAQDNNYGKRINASLRGIQFVRDGDAFSGGRPAEADEFAPVEGVSATDADFGTAPVADSEFA
jgi:hypothetical protein